MMDWYVTFANIAGGRVPQDRKIDGKDLGAVLAATGRCEAEPFFYFSLRAPHEDQGYVVAAVRDGKWRYKVAQSGYYPKFVEPLMRVGLYHHGELLFDLKADPGETRNLIDEHPQVAERLRKLVEDFYADNDMPHLL